MRRAEQQRLTRSGAMDGESDEQLAAAKIRGMRIFVAVR